MKKTVLWIITALLLVTPASAHYLWISAGDGVYTVNRGMPADPPHPYDPACVTDIEAYDAQGTALAVQATAESDRMLFKTDRPAALAVAVSDWGYRVNTTSGKKMMTRQQAEAQGLNVMSAFFSRQFSKTVFDFSPAQLRPLGLTLEILPLADPTAARPGAAVPFRLLYEGRPLAKTTIYTHDGRKIETDEKGAFRLPVQQAGLHSIYARHKVPVTDNAEMDYLQLMTFMTFTISQ